VINVLKTLIVQTAVFVVAINYVLRAAFVCWELNITATTVITTTNASTVVAITISAVPFKVANQPAKLTTTARLQIVAATIFASIMSRAKARKIMEKSVTIVQTVTVSIVRRRIKSVLVFQRNSYRV